MPTFIFNKLIRDKLKEEYVKMGQVAVYKKLSRSEVLDAFKQKIIEEAREIPVDGTKEDIISELADIQQVIDDFARRTHITDEEIATAKEKKFTKKGGFSQALYVEKLELKDDDEWVSYYRKSPNVFEEIIVESDTVMSDSTMQDAAELVVPLVPAGIYEHYKGNRYEVVGVGLDSETMKPVVVYVPLTQEGKNKVSFWVRPYEMFLEFVDVDGKKVERFKKI